HDCGMPLGRLTHRLDPLVHRRRNARYEWTEACRRGSTQETGSEGRLHVRLPAQRDLRQWRAYCRCPIYFQAVYAGATCSQNERCFDCLECAFGASTQGLSNYPQTDHQTTDSQFLSLKFGVVPQMLVAP